jgi:hypothetical protein
VSRYGRAVLKRLQQAAKEYLESFELKDGTRYYYDRMEAMGELYVYGYDTELGNDPDPPEIWTKLHQAKDPRSVLARFRAVEPTKAFIDLEKLYYQEGRTHHE